MAGYGITDAVSKNSAIQGGTKCKITYDSKGLVTSGADLSASDIPNLDWSKITSGVPIVSSWSSTTLDTNIPSEKLVKTSLDGKQPTLVSGTNIKTVNNTSLLGSGNVAVQPTLIGSGTGQNIKTVGGTNILGSGNIPFPTVTNNNPSLAWSTKSTVGSIGSTNLEVTMPSNPVTKTAIESVLNVSAIYNNQALIVKNGVLDFGEAGKVDDVKVNGTSVVNTSTKEALITVPTKVSDLTNDVGYTTNIGTVTQVKVGSTEYNPTAGIVSLPAYPTVNNATLTIQKNGTTVNTFTANASSNVTANITVPTKTSDLTNDSGYITGLGFDDLSSHPTTLAGYGITDAQSKLVSGTNIKTVNNGSLLGSGNISVGTVRNLITGVGLTGGPITATGTIKAKLLLKAKQTATA